MEFKKTEVKRIKGKAKIERRNLRRRAGSIRKKVNKRKREYITMTRKSRAYLAELLSHDSLSKENYLILRKEIRARAFKSRANLKERLAELKTK